MEEQGAGRHPDTGQPIGPALPSWTRRPRPPREPLLGDSCRLEPISTERHAEELFQAYVRDERGAGWTYLPYGPFPDLGAFRSWVDEVSRLEDPLFFAIQDSEKRAVGVTSYLRINPEMGSIEVGHIHYSPSLQRTRAATEAMYLMARRVFDELGYRSYEWKCDDLNAPSRRAAKRLGFTYEGTFRQDKIYKGRNRNTAWYSMTDDEWPEIRDTLERWLHPSNFDEQGQQRSSLATPK